MFRKNIKKIYSQKDAIKIITNLKLLKNISVHDSMSRQAVLFLIDQCGRLLDSSEYLKDKKYLFPQFASLLTNSVSHENGGSKQSQSVVKEGTVLSNVHFNLLNFQQISKHMQASVNSQLGNMHIRTLIYSRDAIFKEIVKFAAICLGEIQQDYCSKQLTIAERFKALIPSVTTKCEKKDYLSLIRDALKNIEQNTLTIIDNNSKLSQDTADNSPYQLAVQYHLNRIKSYIKLANSKVMHRQQLKTMNNYLKNINFTKAKKLCKLIRCLDFELECEENRLKVSSKVISNLWRGRANENNSSQSQPINKPLLNVMNM